MITLDKMVRVIATEQGVHEEADLKVAIPINIKRYDLARAVLSAIEKDTE